MQILKVLAVAAIAYLLGSISTSVIVSRLFGHMDIREHGSGNAGTTNTLRVMGPKFAIIVLAGDALKGAIAALVGGWLMGSPNGAYLGATMGMIGHMYPVFFGFRGGKGVATVAGALIAADWRLFLVVIGVFILLFMWKHTVSIGSIGAAIVAPFAAYFVTGGNWFSTLWIILLAVTVIGKHHENIGRIMAGTEPRTNLRKKT